MFDVSGPPVVAGRVLWNSVCPAVLLSFCTFSWNFIRNPRNPYEIASDSQIFQILFFFVPKIGKMDKKWAKNCFFIEKFGITFHWICSIMKIYICCVFAQISYSEEFLFLWYGPICFQPIWLQDFLINYISRINQWNRLTICMLIMIFHIN